MNIIRKKAKIIIDAEYEQKIIKFFKTWIDRYCGIDCFAVLVILPNNDVLHLSTHSELSKIYHENNYGLYDQPVIKKHFQEHLFYPWVTSNPTKTQKEIHLIREKIFNLNSGTNFVRKIKNNNNELFHLLYCVSSHKKDPLGYFKFACCTQEILKVGDFAYNSLLPILQENCEKYILPKVESQAKTEIERTSKLLKNYVFSNDMLKNIPRYINRFTVNDNIANSIVEELKIYSNTYDSTYNYSRSHLRLVK